MKNYSTEELQECPAYARLMALIKAYDSKGNQQYFAYRALKYLQLATNLLLVVIPGLNLSFQSLSMIQSMIALAAINLTIESLQQFNQHHQKGIGLRLTTERLRQEEHFYISQSGLYKNIFEPHKLLAERTEQAVTEFLSKGSNTVKI